jgi:hypothetical protein
LEFWNMEILNPTDCRSPCWSSSWERERERERVEEFFSWVLSFQNLSLSGSEQELDRIVNKTDLYRYFMTLIICWNLCNIKWSRMVMDDESGRMWKKWLWPILKHYSNICLEDLGLSWNTYAGIADSHPGLKLDTSCSPVRHINSVSTYSVTQ